MSGGPAQSTTIIGHETAKKQFQEAFVSGRLHHAWLLVGTQGIGKASLAYHMAHMILSGGENTFTRFNPEHCAARLIMAEAHPDLFVLRRATDDKTGAIKDTISVDQARKLAPFLRMTASQGSHRVALIDEAHALNRNGQNAILKMIEEPPAGAIILITATTIGTLLPTIRSRCRLLSLDELSQPEMETIFARLGVDLPSGASKARLFSLAAGSIGMAQRILETEVLPLYDEVLSLLNVMPDLDMARLHKLADMIGRKGDAEVFRVLTSLLMESLRRAVRATALGEPDETGLARRFTVATRLDKALEVWENSSRTFLMAESANLDNKLAFITAMTNIAKMTS